MIPFNGGTSIGSARGKPGNNYDGLSGDKFGVTESRAQAWTAKRVVSYLLTSFLPVDINGDSKIIFRMAETDQLDYKLPVVEYAGQTPWQLLNRVVDRRRALGVRANVDYDASEAADVVTLTVFTALLNDVTLPDGTVLKANTNQLELDMSSAVNINSLQLTKSIMQQYDRVRVIGERRGSVCSLQPGVSVEADWEESKAAEYNVARSEDSNYDGLDDDDKSRANARFRAADEFRDVFCQWLVPADWDQTAFSNKVFPGLNGDGEVDDSVKSAQWVAALRLQSRVPMLAGEDYSGEFDPLEDADPQDFLPLMVWFDKELSERLDADADTTEDGRKWSVQTRVLQNAPGLRLEVVGGQQHFIASDLYEENGTYEALEESDHALASDSWRATVYMQWQDRVEAIEPAEPVSGDVQRTLEIMVPNAFLDYLVPGTTVGVSHPVSGSTDYVTAAGGWLRDDRERLQNIAALAWEYYQSQPQRLVFSYRAVSSVLPVGSLVTQLTGEGDPTDVNTVVTSLQVDLRNQSTTVQTAFAELDFAEVVQ